MTSWNKSLKLIVGGNGLLSKRPERYSPKNWPTYYRKAIGSRILAENGKWYQDFSEFSIGCNPFGYAPSHLRYLPLKYVFSSPLSTLNSRYEYLLASQLNVALDESRIWKFTRGGGESMSLAVRFARAIAIINGPILVTGYHGWHDWYLAANIKNSSLDELLIPGLKPLGVPDYLKNTINACNIEELDQAILKHKPSIVVFEGSRSELQNKSTIKTLKSFQTNGGILIADEITSGFRTKSLTFSKKYNLKPDILILGKALGSGYAISAVGCKNDVKNADLLNDVFASSTFWTEEIGLKAGYLTTKYFHKNKEKIISKLEDNTKIIRNIILKNSNLFKFNTSLNSHPSLVYTNIRYKEFDTNIIKSMMCAEMSYQGVLFSNNIYPSTAHNKYSLKLFEKSLAKSMRKVSSLLESKDISFLRDNYGAVSNGFSRLTK